MDVNPETLKGFFGEYGLPVSIGFVYLNLAATFSVLYATNTKRMLKSEIEDNCNESNLVSKALSFVVRPGRYLAYACNNVKNLIQRV